MLDRPSEQLTRLLHDWSEQGDERALSRFVEQALPELRRMARGRLRHERDGHGLQSGDLVGAAWLKIAPQLRRRWESRRHFYAVFSQVMFQVLVNEAERRNAAKRAGREVPLDDDLRIVSGEVEVDMLDFALALEELGKSRPRAALAAKLRHLSGMTEEEIASSLEWEGRAVSLSTVRRDLKVATAFLFRALRGEHG